MLLSITLAFVNGILITANRVINSKLGSYIGPLSSSFWNHLVGAIFLAIILPFWDSSSYLGKTFDLPLYLLIGGLIGVFFVAINNYVLPKIGVLKTVVLVVGGQMVFSVMIDIYVGKIKSFEYAFIGSFLITLGTLIANLNLKEKADEKS